MNPSVRTLVMAALLASGCASNDVVRPEAASSPQTPAIDRTWVATVPVQCLGNPWERAWSSAHPGGFGSYPSDSAARAQIIIDYYRGEGVEVRDLRLRYWAGGVCYACSCPAGYTLYLLVDDDDVAEMIARGYRKESPA